MIYFKWWKERNYNQEYSTQQDSHSVLMEKSKAFQTSKSQENSANQTRFTTNAKGTSPGRKHKRRKRPTENKSKTIKKKTVIRSYILIITLSINGLNAQWKDRWGDENMYKYTLPLTTLFDSPNYM